MDGQTCPHCGEPLPVIVDAFCPACREPYEQTPPAEAEFASRQHALLVAYRGFRSSPPTVGRLLLRSLPAHLLLAALFGGAAGVYWLLGMGDAALVVIGALAGVLLRDFGVIIRSVRAWPAVAAVIDWSRVDHLLGGGGPAAPG